MLARLLALFFNVLMDSLDVARMGIQSTNVRQSSCNHQSLALESALAGFQVEVHKILFANKEGKLLTHLGFTVRYASSTKSSSFDTAAWDATISLACEIMVPKSEAAQKKRKMQ